MTKEELEKEAEEIYIKTDKEFMDCQDEGEIFNLGYLAGAEPRERRKEELIALINAERERQEKCDDVHLRKIAELEKENAELKGTKDVATLIRANNDTVTTLMQLNNKLVSKGQQLTKAKEIIKKFSEFVYNGIEYDPEHPQEHTDLWNKLCEEAEQFLKE